MALNQPRWLAVAALALVALCVSQAAANFAASPGFSGRSGATCLACHTVAPFPFTAPVATAVFEGVPEGWEPSAAYTFTIRVEGGPDPLPAPAPQGGFEIASNGGAFRIPASMSANLRLVEPTEVTYTAAGTLMREWTVEWVAPGLEAKPVPVTFWVAVLAANGNHVVATNTSDGGERFDAADSLVRVVPPSTAAQTAWLALSLRLPVATAERDEAGWTIVGRHVDGNASALAYRLDDGPWQRRDTGTSWRIVLPGLAGAHTIALRSEGLGRASPELAIALPAQGEATVGGDGNKATPLGLLVLPALALALLFASRRPRP